MIYISHFGAKRGLALLSLSATAQDGAVHLWPSLATLYGEDHHTTQRHDAHPACFYCWPTLADQVGDDAKWSRREMAVELASKNSTQTVCLGRALANLRALLEPFFPWYSTTPPHNCQYLPSSLLPRTCIFAEKHSKHSLSYNQNVLYLHRRCRQSISLTSYFADPSCR